MHRSWTDGTPWPTSTRSASAARRARSQQADLRKELRGTEVREAIMASVVVIAVAVFIAGLVMGGIDGLASADHRGVHRYTPAGVAPSLVTSRRRRLTGVGRRYLDAEFLRPAGHLVH